MTATADRTDIFYGEDYQTTGSLPRVLISRGERRIGKSPLYFGVNGEYASILRSVTPATGRDHVRGRRARAVGIALLRRLSIYCH